MQYQAPHKVEDAPKLASMVALLQAGGSLPPILVSGEIAYSGSHRLAAYDVVGMVPQVIQVTDAQVAEAMTICGLEPGYDDIADFEPFERALADILAR